MSTSSINDISAILLDAYDDAEDGEIVEEEDDDVVIINDRNNNESFYDVLKRSFDKRNHASANGSVSLSLDETFGDGTDGKDGRGKDNRVAPDSGSSSAKRLRNLRDLRRQLDASFSAYEEKTAHVEDSFCVVVDEGESPPAESSFSRDVDRERARQAKATSAQMGKRNVDDRGLMSALVARARQLRRNEAEVDGGDGSNKGEERAGDGSLGSTKLVERARQLRRKEESSVEDGGDSSRGVREGGKKNDSAVGVDLTALIHRALSKKDSPRAFSTPARGIGRESDSTANANPPRLKSVLTPPLAPSSASTPKRRERYYGQRPALSKPIYVEVAEGGISGVRTVVVGNPQTRGQPTKRARSPDAPETGNRSKRTRWDEERKVETVDLTQRRPPFSQINRRMRATSFSGARFAPPRPRAPARAHVRARTAVYQNQCAEYNRQELLAKMIDLKFDHVIFIDLDNWKNFFGHLTTHLPSQSFVWGFWSEQTNWRPPHGNRFFDELVRTDRFEETMAGKAKDAADFAMVLRIGQMDKDIRKPDVGFTIITGDRGFQQVRLDFLGSRRAVDVINPHVLSRKNDCTGERESMDSVLRRRCRRSLSTEPKIRSPLLPCR